MSDSKKLSTSLIHSSLDFAEGTGAVMPPIFLTSTFEHGNEKGFDYTRSGNPNFKILEDVLNKIENSQFSTVFATGVSAISAVISTLKSGDLVLAEENVYGCTYRLFEQVFRKFGVNAEYIDFTAPGALDTLKAKKPAMVWIESPTNPMLKIIDLASVAKVTKELGAALVVDNTFATGALQRPLDLGADVSLLSTTKYINGHSDALGGVVCTNSKEWQGKMIFAQKAVGLSPSPFDCWLITRGAKTLPLRMKQHCENGLKLAQFLKTEIKAPPVNYPFLEDQAGYAIAVKQMSGGGGIVTADFGISYEETVKFLKGLQIFTMAESLGGIESLICHPASMTHASVPRDVRLKVGITDSLIRFSVGIEDFEDLKQDIQSAWSLVSA